MKLYKLTDKNDRTYNETQWGENVTHEAPGEGKLCTNGWIHAYTSPLLAEFINPMMGNFDKKTMHLWECEGEIGITDHGLKVGCKTLTTIRRMRRKRITTEQRLRFGILCALQGYKDSGFVKWANGWLSGKDRSTLAARSAASAARSAAYAADIDLIAIAEEAMQDEQAVGGQ